MVMAITWQHLYKITFRGDKTGHNPTDRSKLGSKRHILTDKNGIPLSTIITSANTHDITIATDTDTDTVDSIVIKRQLSSSSKSKHNQKKKQNLCLDKAYHSKEIEQEIVKGRYNHIYFTKEKRRNGTRNIQQGDGL